MTSVSGCGGGSSAVYQSMHTQRSQELFAKLDVNGDSSIDASELEAFTDFVSQQTGSSSMDSGTLMTALDSDGDGTVSSAELTDNSRSLFDALRQQLQGTRTDDSTQPPDAAEMFAAIDSDGDGSISADEFKAGMPKGHGGPPPPRDGEGGGGIGRIIASLLGQYGQSAGKATSSHSLSLAA